MTKKVNNHSIQHVEKQVKCSTYTSERLQSRGSDTALSPDTVQDGRGKAAEKVKIGSEPTHGTVLT